MEIKEFLGKWNYSGMINKNNQPHGYGRAIRTNNDSFILMDNGKMENYIDILVLFINKINVIIIIGVL